MDTPNPWTGGPAYRVVTPRCCLRAYRPSDAPALQEALAVSLEDLRPWIPWAHREPLGDEENLERCRRFRGLFDLGQDFIYGIHDRAGDRILGGTGLHPRSHGGTLEIGYWIRRGETGRGLATEVAGALCRVAFEVHGCERLEIRVDPQNDRSLAIPRRLGFTEEGTLRRFMPVEGQGRRDTTVFSMLPEEHARGFTSGLEVEAYDGLGRLCLGRSGVEVPDSDSVG